MGKAFEKQMKTIEVQGEKQAEALKYLKPKEKKKAIEDRYGDNLLMQRETFNRLLNERMDEIREIGKKKSNYNNLVHITPGIRPTNFIEFRGPLHILK